MDSKTGTRVFERLGLDPASADGLPGMREFYRAWCLNVPFDNIRKLIALSANTGKPLPGGTPDDFFENWLEHGTGGTCWPSSNALHWAASAVGLQVDRAVGSMWDTGDASHATSIVHFGKRRFLLDSSILTMNPLPLDPGVVHFQPGPLNPVEVEPVDGTFVIWFEAPNTPVQFPCRLLHDSVEESLYWEQYEATRARSIFNHKLFVRRNFPDKLVILYGNRRWERTIDGDSVTELTRDELIEELTGRHRYSQAIVDRWVSSGGLDVAFQPSETKRELPKLDRVPPSKRPVTA